MVLQARGPTIANTAEEETQCILYESYGNPVSLLFARISELLAENIVFNSPILVRPIQGRDLFAAIFAQSSETRSSGTYRAEFKLDERTTFLRWVGTMKASSSRAWRLSWTTSRG